MNSKTITYICVGIAVVVLFLVFTNLNYSEEPIISGKNESEIYLGEPVEGKIERDDFVKNEVMISFKDNASTSEIERYLKGLSDVKSYDDLGINIYVLTLNFDFESRSELNKYCSTLTKSNLVEYCEPNNIIKLDDCSKGPC